MMETIDAHKIRDDNVSKIKNASLTSRNNNNTGVMNNNSNEYFHTLTNNYTEEKPNDGSKIVKIEEGGMIKNSIFLN